MFTSERREITSSSSHRTQNILTWKLDHRKLIRQTIDMNGEGWTKLKNLDFVSFLYHVEMFKETKAVNEYSEMYGSSQFKATL